MSLARFKSEFSKRKLYLRHHDVQDFASSKWIPDKWLLLWRLLSAVYLTVSTITIFSILNRFLTFIFLTMWSYIVLTAYFINAALVSIKYFRKETLTTAPCCSQHLAINDEDASSTQKEYSKSKSSDALVNDKKTSEDSEIQAQQLDRENDDETVPTVDSFVNNADQIQTETQCIKADGCSDTFVPKADGCSDTIVPKADGCSDTFVPKADRLETRRLPFEMKTQWVLFYIASTSSIAVSLAFWTMLFRGIPSTVFVRFLQFTTHLFNCIFMIVENSLCSIPWNFLHLCFPLLYFTVYMLFSAIYWALGGKGLNDASYIYPFIDYGERPVLAVGTILVMFFIAVPLLFSCHYCLYILRCKLLSKFKPSPENNPNCNDTARNVSAV